jgi:hypothetical protein
VPVEARSSKANSHTCTHGPPGRHHGRVPPGLPLDGGTARWPPTSPSPKNPPATSSSPWAWIRPDPNRGGSRAADTRLGKEWMLTTNGRQRCDGRSHGAACPEFQFR